MFVSIHLHQEIENLKCQLVERENHIVQMDTNVIHHAQRFPKGENAALRQELLLWQEKYQRLHESHKKLQKVNQGLEDKLLKIVDKYETEKAVLTRDLSDITTKLVEARFSITELEEESEHYRNDCNIAIQLLQCKPSHFVSHKYSSIPLDLQERVKSHLNNRTKKETQNNNPEVGTIRIPIPTFPPTAMVYSVSKISNVGSVKQNGSSQASQRMSKSPPDCVSAAIIAKVLAERTKERNAKKQVICMACKCEKQNVYYHNKETQTKWSSKIVSCLSCGNQPICVHSCARKESSSSTDSHWCELHADPIGDTKTNK
ncbi:tight junction-associated protein 1-like isoform X2 [Limulus polyphemus]|uniref:Tight junction-associated protein 1-like isoform X2 n=1 Tax=Limulus polyphemus TaxID=6850 RepID=A0ABM1TR72_LIMPO|nr:tight junction-associated protein 1-like isoform X2 [Limulus polyphemus]